MPFQNTPKKNDSNLLLSDQLKNLEALQYNRIEKLGANHRQSFNKINLAGGDLDIDSGYGSSPPATLRKSSRLVIDKVNINNLN